MSFEPELFPELPAFDLVIEVKPTPDGRWGIYERSGEREELGDTAKSRDEAAFGAVAAAFTDEASGRQVIVSIAPARPVTTFVQIAAGITALRPVPADGGEPLWMAQIEAGGAVFRHAERGDLSALLAAALMRADGSLTPGGAGVVVSSFNWERLRWPDPDTSAPPVPPVE